MLSPENGFQKRFEAKVILWNSWPCPLTFNPTLQVLLFPLHSFPAASLYSSLIRMFSRQMFSSISLKFCDSSLVSASRAPLLFRRAVSVSRNILLVLHYTVLRNQVCSPRFVIKFLRQSLFLLVFGPYPPWPSFSPPAVSCPAFWGTLTTTYFAFVIVIVTFRNIYSLQDPSPLRLIWKRIDKEIQDFQEQYGWFQMSRNQK